MAMNVICLSGRRQERSFGVKRLPETGEFDTRNLELLRDLGWRICVVWECALRGKYRFPKEDVILACSDWLESGSDFLEIASFNEAGS